MSTPTHCLVHWLKDDKYSVVKVTNLAISQGESLKIYSVYLAKFGQNFFDAKVLDFGTSSYCSALLKDYPIPSDTNTNKAISNSYGPLKSSLKSLEESKSRSSSKQSKSQNVEYVRPLLGGSQKSPRFQATAEKSNKFLSMFDKRASPWGNREEKDRSYQADYNSDEDSLPKSSKKTVRNISSIYSSEKTHDLENEILTSKVNEQAFVIRNNELEIEQLQKKTSFLENKVKNLHNGLTPEVKERMLLFSMNTLKSFGEEKHLIEISSYSKENNSLSGLVTISSKYPKVLIDSSIKKDILQDFKAKLSNAKIFKDTMTVFYPKESDWSNRNAKMFWEMCPDTINAVIDFIQCSDESNVGFSTMKARKALREKCSDVRAKLKKSKQRNGYCLPNDQDLEGITSDEEDEEVVAKEASQQSNQELLLLNSTFNDTLILSPNKLNNTKESSDSLVFDSSFVNRPLSRKNKLVSDGELSQHYQSKRSNK